MNLGVKQTTRGLVNSNDVLNLFAYDEWANRRLVDAAAQLTSEEYTQDLGASFGSVRRTLIHIMWGEKRWLHRVSGV